MSLRHGEGGTAGDVLGVEEFGVVVAVVGFGDFGIGVALVVGDGDGKGRGLTPCGDADDDEVALVTAFGSVTTPSVLTPDWR